MKIPILVIFFGVICALSRKVQVSEFAEGVSDSFLSNSDELNSDIASPYNSDGLGKIPVDNNNDAFEHFKENVAENRDLEDSYYITRRELIQERVSVEPSSHGNENLHTLIVDETVYETKTVYFTHTEAVVVTKCCKQKPHYTKCSSTVSETTPVSSSALPDTSCGCDVPTTSETEVPATTSGCDVPTTTSETEVPATTCGCDVPATTCGCDVPATTCGCDVPATTSGCSIPAQGCQCSTTIIISAGCNCPSTALSHTCGYVATSLGCCKPSAVLKDQTLELASAQPSVPLEKRVESSSKASGDSDSHAHDHDHKHDNNIQKGTKSHGIRMEKLQKMKLACIIVGVISGIWIVI